MIRAVKSRLGTGYCVSVKIRIDADLSRTNTLICNALHAGASLITVHGRTRHQSSSSDPVNLDGVKFAVECANACGLQTARGTSPGDAWAHGEDGGAGGLAPCVVNGDIWTRDDAQAWRTYTGARGAMSARGLLANPALFSGAPRTPPAAVAEFVDKSLLWGLPTALLQYVYPPYASRHVAYMLEESLPSRFELNYFNSLASPASILDWLEEAGYVPSALG
ncbi:unnamed protein product [Malassezia sympodialis ATCC 42132]|uniref:uncharacterized protein n=1 Tax=Malassezia sympodialis (strain ATCC 42132) TaxID=1230383 RepID=UPI0002C1D9F8|nr:uncharacterized protein MSY001_0357 [Malassezia sympodialis ATCC 42132]CCU97651.1 unnamed protein product [Malassezia sympodialis ATCC 42132]|eukprot:XP_018738991.1 uncharacterized protein MSY001_0357 [Malassezia sympodialis ATCC 42132]